eukprot:6407351-Amphidinium_carterae.3
MKKVKPFWEQKTPYADTISDMKRPFDHPRDMPTHVVHHLEVRDLPTLPRNLDWCFPELNMYAQTGLFPLHFQKQLLAYYDESIAYMCDTREDYRTRTTLQQLTISTVSLTTSMCHRKCMWIGADGRHHGPTKEL